MALRVVDFQTGGSVSVKMRRSSRLQLGVYQLSCSS